MDMHKVYQDIILSNTTIIDVRSESEYQKAHLPNSINIPILNDCDRDLVGKCYKEKGSEIAIELGHELVSGDKKEAFLKEVKEVLEQEDNVMLMCFRGGNRSGITKDWVHEHLGYDIEKLEGGYKAFRTYLIESLKPENISVKPIIVAGNTGCGKTILIKKLSMAIDLENLAKHRGSAFGSYIEKQPMQATFENTLAYEMIKLQAKNPSFVAFESESKNIGKNVIPNDFFEYMHTSPYVMLETTIDERTEITYNDYIVSDIEKYESLHGENGRKLWREALRNKLQKLKRKLGQDRLNECLAIFDEAEKSDIRLHKKWIKYLLLNYYDPMYQHHRDRWADKIVCVKKLDEMYEYLEEKNKTGQYLV